METNSNCSPNLIGSPCWMGWYGCLDDGVPDMWQNDVWMWEERRRRPLPKFSIQLSLNYAKVTEVGVGQGEWQWEEMTCLTLILLNTFSSGLVQVGCEFYFYELKERDFVVKLVSWLSLNILLMTSMEREEEWVGKPRQPNWLDEVIGQK